MTPRTNDGRVSAFAPGWLAALVIVFGLYDYSCYFLSPGLATILTYLHVLLILFIAIINLRAGLAFFAVSLVFSDEISRYLWDYSGDTGVVNFTTVALAGVALVNWTALALAALGAVLLLMRWREAPDHARATPVDLAVLAIVAVYFAATLHGVNSVAQNPRLAVNHLNLPIMIGGLYLAVRAAVVTNGDFRVLWSVFVLAIAAKILGWGVLALLGEGSAFGTTLRVGFGSVWTAFVLVLVYGLLIQQRNLVLPARQRLAALVCVMVAAGLIIMAAGRMLWLLTALALGIVVLLSEGATRIRYLLVGAIAGTAVLALMLAYRPEMFETIRAMAGTLRFWDAASREATPSTSVRVYEFLNIHAQLRDHGNLLLGDGPGSTFSDRYHPFPFGLGEGDYSIEEQEHREFRNSHTLFTQLMLHVGYGGMAGYLSALACAWLALYRLRRALDDPAARAVALALLAFLPAMAYMAWNAKANMLLGLTLGLGGAWYAHHVRVAGRVEAFLPELLPE